MNIRILASIASVIVILAVIAIFPIHRNDNVALSPSPSASPEASVTATAPTPTPSAKPKSGIEFKEVQNYQVLAQRFDATNRLLMLDEACMSLRPSQIAYKNNTEVMLDNTMSAQARILKIGGKEYKIEARSWLVTTLSTLSVPARLVIFCGNMELGGITLE